jgi:hypothetical protein
LLSGERVRVYHATCPCPGSGPRRRATSLNRSTCAVRRHSLLLLLMVQLLLHLLMHLELLVLLRRGVGAFDWRSGAETSHVHRVLHFQKKLRSHNTINPLQFELFTTA